MHGGWLLNIILAMACNYVVQMGVNGLTASGMPAAYQHLNDEGITTLTSS